LFFNRLTKQISWHQKCHNVCEVCPEGKIPDPPLESVTPPYNAVLPDNIFCLKELLPGFGGLSDAKKGRLSLPAARKCWLASFSQDQSSCSMSLNAQALRHFAEGISTGCNSDCHFAIQFVYASKVSASKTFGIAIAPFLAEGG
jgi:hypothetical protein